VFQIAVADDDQLDEHGETEFVTVVVPEGAAPGQMLYLTAADGREVSTEVPDEAMEGPGHEFEVYVGNVDERASG
jgi:hypothetical protein